MTCSPETDPATMRVRRPEMGTRRILDEEETHPTADRPHAARSGRRAGRGSLGPRDRKEAWHQRGDLPSLEEPLRWNEGRCDQVPEGAGKGERPLEEDRRRASGVQGDRPAQVHPALRGPSEGRVGPLVGRAHGRALTGEPALWLAQGVGAVETGRLVGEQEAGTPVVEGGGPEGARKAAKTAAPCGRRERERV